jgi:hypothetical protein
LAAGNGLVFNPGEYVEGYTNFLWALLMAIPHWLGIDVILFARCTSFLAAAHRYFGRPLETQPVPTRLR